MSTSLPALPLYDRDQLASLAPDALLDLLVRDEDCAPRAVIDECVGRGETMVERLATRVERDDFWNGDVTDGEWWLRLHLVMILGLMPGERAGLLLVAVMRRMEQAKDDDLQDG